MECIKQLFCCIDWQNNNQPQRQQQRRSTRNPAPTTPKKKSTKSIRPKRLVTKFAPNQWKLISDQQRKAGFKPIYACPLCFQYFNKILACSQCSNFICLSCYIQYQTKSRKRKQLMKCAFCFSTKSDFVDHDKQGHSYWDTTHKQGGFLTKQQRQQVDNQLKKSGGKSLLKNEVNLDQIRQEHHQDNQIQQSQNNLRARGQNQRQQQQQHQQQQQQQQQRESQQVRRQNEQNENINHFQNIQVRSNFQIQQSRRSFANPNIIQLQSLHQNNQEYNLNYNQSNNINHNSNVQSNQYNSISVINRQ